MSPTTACQGRSRLSLAPMLPQCHNPLRFLDKNAYPASRRTGPQPCPLAHSHALDLWSSTKRLCEALGECRGAKPLCRGSRGVPLIFCDFPGRAGGKACPPQAGTTLMLPALPAPNTVGSGLCARPANRMPQPSAWGAAPAGPILRYQRPSSSIRGSAESLSAFGGGASPLPGVTGGVPLFA